MAVCPCCGDEGWVCAEHPHLPVEHDGCGGAGQPCEHPDCPHGQRNRPKPTITWDAVLASVDETAE